MAAMAGLLRKRVGALCASLVTGAMVALVPAVAPAAGAATLPPVIPQPVSEAAGTGGSFTFDANTSITVTTSATAVAAVASYLAGLARPSTGLALPVVSGANTATDSVVLDATGPSSLGQEGYTLSSTSSSVVITANTADGLFHGVQTLRQILPTQIEATTAQSGVSWNVPSVAISDSPRYAYRGVMIDIARHFYPVSAIERVISQAAMYKLNVLHLHMSDDQGWRIAINAYPDLTRIGSNIPVASGAVDGGPGYYTQADYQAIAAYAAARYITVVPEVDGPGHTGAAVTSMATGTDPNDIPIDPNNSADNANVQTFLDKVAAEIAPMSSSGYFHVGGDEFSGTAAQYNAWVSSSTSAVAAAGKTPIGWNEMGQVTTIPTTSVLEYWAGDNTGIATGLERGEKLIEAPAPHDYFDMKYDANTPLGLTWAGDVPLSKAYGWDPSAATASLESAAGIPAGAVPNDPTIGVEAALWADSVPATYTTNEVEGYADFMLLPRLPALAEVGWSTASAVTGSTSWTNFASRIAAQGPRWDLLGYGYYRTPEVTWPARPVQLINHWTMDGISGTTVPDSGPAGNNGTVTGTTTFAAGKVGNAAVFDGSVSPISVGASDLPAPWTASAWVDPTASNTSVPLLSGYTMALKVQQYNGTGELGATKYGTADYTVSYKAPLNTWTYVSFVDDGTQITVYANGQSVGTIAATMSLSRDAIGSASIDHGKENLDEVTVFNNALTASQANALYTSAQTGGTNITPPPPPAPTLVDDWTMNSVSGSTVTDSATGGHNGTVTGMTTFAPGKVGNAAVFDGSVSPITTSAADLPAPWTASAWVDPTASNASVPLLSSSTMALKVQQWNGTGELGATKYGTADYAISYKAPLNTWTYVTWVDDGATITIYANGQSVGTISASMPLGRAWIGSSSKDVGKEDLEEVSVFSSALTASQAAALYNSAQTGGTSTG
ncbi:MAG TPA: family 20 glycosylhydrolase [Actinocrinis sp.]|uniref:family 20 glycosylhydrolase n=1 Tax=Actinocrinis sp. TaxID=1920516 RepID=UPI002DDD6475|nr:family 20 glycosylhydrolase [Actinocrinis sp.]HEV2345422.1 family 20 glycosylhydrolase [Actinocrinis sp.]